MGVSFQGASLSVAPFQSSKAFTQLTDLRQQSSVATALGASANVQPQAMPEGIVAQQPPGTRLFIQA
ncbi:MAG: hypothetical protein SFZ03_05890 [Candidatus Melainabacteria bacterium]|nr:hypothetical protein [Candidatus Melainabacteria bacterium]